MLIYTYLWRELRRRMRQSWPARTSRPSLMALRIQSRPAGCAAALAAAVSLLLSACGSGTPSAAQSSAAKPTQAASAGTAGSRSAFCAISRRYWTKRLLVARSENKPNQSGMGNMSGDSGKPLSHRAVLRATRDMQAALPELEASAPAGMQAAVRTIVNGEKPYFAAIVQADGDLTKIPPTDMARAMSVLAAPQGKAVIRYWSQTCEVRGLGRITSSEHM